MAEPTTPVVLVGMMGSGKSTVGRRLASRLGRPFLDCDDELVRRTGRSVREWFETEGESGFRRAEAELLADVLAAPGPAVIAAGGGVVVDAGNRDLLRRRARVVWLRAGAPFLAGRVGRKGHRPLLDGADLDDVVARLVVDRTPLYEEVADLVVDVEPFHHAHEKPKRKLAVRVAEMVEAAEAADAAAVAGTAPAPGPGTVGGPPDAGNAPAEAAGAAAAIERGDR